MENFFDGAGKPREEYGVFGIFGGGGGNVASDAYYALYALQHRGQESCGIAVGNEGGITGYRDLGLVADVFWPERLARLGGGQMAIGHCRYGTKGETRRSNAQPLVVRHVKGGMALAHNGGVTNAGALREQPELNGVKEYIFHSDAEVIAYCVTRERLSAPSIQEAVARAADRLTGAYSLVVMSPQKLIAARDPLGFRPLCIGTRGSGYVVASESCALDIVGAKFLRDVLPGEVITISAGGFSSDTSRCGGKSAVCVFEYIYFARPDSVIDGTGVHEAREREGAVLAAAHPVKADAVVGVPDSGLDAALGYSRQSGIPYDIGFIKNKYIGRTFIQPTQRARENMSRIKLNVIESAVRGKSVVLIDDSIVRGTTSALIVRLLREAGARGVHMRLSSPPFLFPCYFGTDIDSSENLLAHNYSLDEMKGIIGVDSLGFLPVEALGGLLGGSPRGLCSACFTGEYPAPPPAAIKKSRFETGIHGRGDM